MQHHHGLFDKYSNTIYHDHIICAPLLLKLPGSQEAGCRIQQNVELIDIFPTLCGLTEVDAGGMPLDGKNLLDLPRDNDRPRGGVAFSESYGIKTVIKDGWKLIHYVNHEEGELYCLLEDDEERNNRFKDPCCQAKRIELLKELVAFFTPTPSAKRQAYIRTLFDDTETAARQCLGKLFKWDKGIVEGAGFWQSFQDDHRLTVIPFDNACRLEKLDRENCTDGLVWNYAPVDDANLQEAMLSRLVDYLACKIRPISTMSGGDAGREQMLFSKGFGFC